jgi:mycothiol synthase
LRGAETEMALTLRPFMEEYSEAVLAVAQAAIPYDPGGNQRWMRERRQVDGRRFLQRHYVVVDNDEERIVGYGAIEQQGPDARHLRLYLLASPGYLRDGVGRALYTRLMEDAEHLHVVSLWMQEYQQETELIGFMQERGFVQTRLTRELRLTLAKANIGQMVPIVEQVAERGIVITTLEEERQRAPNMAQRLYELSNAARGDAFAPLTVQEFLQRLNRSPIMPQGFFVARDGDRLVGLSALAYVEGDSALAQQYWTGVLPAYRRQSIATALRLCCIDAAQRLGYQALVTYTNHSDPVMLALDEKLGFVRLFSHVTLEKTIKEPG